MANTTYQPSPELQTMVDIKTCFKNGYESLAAYSDLIDRINVFPVADGDTGTNLRISLAPLRNHLDGVATEDQLMRCSTGNSGNIAAAFFMQFCHAQDETDLSELAESGSKRARQSVAAPSDGTMLDVFHQLSLLLKEREQEQLSYTRINEELGRTVRTTTELLPPLKEAGVVDSGALAMFIFFDGFFHGLAEENQSRPSIFELFRGKLNISEDYSTSDSPNQCIDLVLQPTESTDDLAKRIEEYGDSIVVMQDKATVKLHIHTDSPENFRKRIDGFGQILQWQAEPIVNQVKEVSDSTSSPPVHIVTDAAGSLPRELAASYHISLLDSYIIHGEKSRPESLYSPEKMYEAMRRKEKLTTAQASTFERAQHYQSLCDEYEHVLYLCVGSAFTGNYAAAEEWRKTNGMENRFHLIDTGAASGRLALIALLTARYTQTDASLEQILLFARNIEERCEEFVFIDELKYLVAGGRLNKASGFFGDLLHMKPVITPTHEGAKKVGVVRSLEGQCTFAMERLHTLLQQMNQPLLLLQYSDNKQWLNDTMLPRIKKEFPSAEILTVPLSLTSGVHMGPGTWSVALAPSNLG